MNKMFRRFGFVGVGLVPVASFAQTVGASGIDPTAVLAAITDGQNKGLLIGLGMLALVIVFKIVKKVRGAA